MIIVLDDGSTASAPAAFFLDTPRALDITSPQVLSA
jgi:hypothetical protein